MLYGVPGVQNEGLVNRVAALTNKVVELEKTVDTLQHSLSAADKTINNQQKWLIGVWVITLILLAVASILLLWRGGAL